MQVSALVYTTMCVIEMPTMSTNQLEDLARFSPLFGCELADLHQPYGWQPVSNKRPATPRGRATYVGDRSIGTTIEKSLDAQATTIPHGNVQRSVAFGIEHINVGSSIDQNLDALMMAASCCMMERRLFVVIAKSDIGFGIEQQHQALKPAFLGCQMQRRRAVRVASVDSGALFDQKLDALMMAVSCCMMESGLAVVISSIDISLGIEQQPQAVEMAAHSSSLQGRSMTLIDTIGVRTLCEKESHLRGRASGRSRNELLCLIHRNERRTRFGRGAIRSRLIPGHTAWVNWVIGGELELRDNVRQGLGGPGGGCGLGALVLD